MGRLLTAILATLLGLARGLLASNHLDEVRRTEALRIAGHLIWTKR